MQKCPVCKKRTIKNTTKMFLSPARTVECSECKSKLTVPKWSVWLNYVYTALMVMLMLWMKVPMVIPIVIVSYLIYLWTLLNYVPLTKIN